MYRLLGISLLLLFFVQDGIAQKSRNKTRFQVHYVTDSVNLTSYSMGLIDDKLAALPGNSEIEHITLISYTDSIPGKGGNEKMALKRARFVKGVLMDHKIPQSRIEVSGMGATRFIASNDTPRGRLLNRRTEVVIFYTTRKDVIN